MTENQLAGLRSQSCLWVADTATVLGRLLWLVANGIFSAGLISSYSIDNVVFDRTANGNYLRELNPDSMNSLYPWYRWNFPLQIPLSLTIAVRVHSVLVPLRKASEIFFVPVRLCYNGTFWFRI